MEKFNNNRNSYRIRCILFMLIMSVGLLILCWLLYNSMLREDPDGWVFLLIGGLTALVFCVWHIIGMIALLNTPEMKADRMTKSAIISVWSIEYGVSFGGVYAVTMVVGTYMNNSLSGALPAIVVGCPLLGIIAFFIACAAAMVIAPKEYRPWLTQEGYQAYLQREQERRMQADIRAAQLAGRIQSPSVTPPATSMPPVTSSPIGGVQGRVFQGQSSGPEIGYYTNDSVYRHSSIPFSVTKVGKYHDGIITDDSGIFSSPTIGRYTWDDVYNCYLLYRGDTQEKFIGRVLRNGEIQAAKHPDCGPLGDLVSPVEYKTIGRYNGDPEGAAAAAYILLFHS